MDNTSTLPVSHLIAFVGMPGCGKSSAVAYFRTKGIPFIRFGDLVEQTLTEQGMEISPENEQITREKLRSTYGMGVFAEKALPRITEAMKANPVVGIDGLYSWEEYVLLKGLYPTLTLVLIFAEKDIRYARLATRPVRPFSRNQAETRDIAEIEHLNKGGPIALADYVIENNEDVQALQAAIDRLLLRLTNNL